MANFYAWLFDNLVDGGLELGSFARGASGCWFGGELLVILGRGNNRDFVRGFLRILNIMGLGRGGDIRGGVISGLRADRSRQVVVSKLIMAIQIHASWQKLAAINCYQPGGL
jgi:hypothetical protein